MFCIVSTAVCLLIALINTIIIIILMIYITDYCLLNVYMFRLIV